ncbi:serine/threonine protein kinase [Leptothoe kymatousa]|uniref:Serine/threonine protein kinase n=1 Tax=Leptothoe kymatousa TAU-MAC 1615 TaxID=2364775 RepID=A0ABS5Y4D5_9CYAN|nr:serine/threonine-protein kinase [Leptothoe kymatousa]MBT9312687.1 serine/threonine protein kinase [Leptothoe kymatousa TAU-MAC 1615]
MNQWILNERYQLQKRLCQKGARHTFIAKDLHTDQRVVVKVLLFGPGFQWQDHKLFERGAAALQTLSFPGIPQYLDYFDVEVGRHKGFAQVQSYIPAKSLQEHLQAGRTFSEDDIQQLALQLLEILAYLHQRQPAVIHRDIKPSNILLEDSTGNPVGQVYLVDFDSVKTGISRSDYTMTIVGTYGYMPPEQFSGNARPASDLYSLGATLIYAVSGKHPADLPQKDMAIDFADQVTLSNNLVTWLKWMTNPNLDRRLATAAQAMQALKESTHWTAPSEPRVQAAKQPANLPKQTAILYQEPVPTLSPTTSQIIVRQTNQPQATEIIFPVKKIDLANISNAPGGLLILLLLLAFLLLTLGMEFIFLIFFFLFSPLGWLAAILLIAILGKPNSLMQRKLCIEANFITETRLFNQTRRYYAPRKSLQLLSDQRRSYVSLRTPNHTFELPTETQADREWLLQTLSQQLQIPVQEHSTLWGL